MKTNRFALVAIVSSTLLIAVTAANAQVEPSWIPINAWGTNTTEWTGAVCSSNGDKCILSGRLSGIASLLTSTNFGESWTYRTNFNSRVACSADGRIVVVANGGGSVQISTNFCTSWTSAGIGAGSYVSMSADGTKMVISGPMNISTNGGASWYGSSFGGGSVAWSGNGAWLYVIHTDGAVYGSTNNGVNWTYTGSPVNAFAWTGLASSHDGSVVAVCSELENGDFPVATPGNLYFSTNYGSGWASAEAPMGWQHVSVSANGQKIAAASKLISGQDFCTVVVTTNRGNTWRPSTLPVNIGYKISAMSPDGTLILVMNYYSRQSYRIMYSQPDVPSLDIANAGGSSSITWPVLTEGYVLQQSTDLTNWFTVTNVPDIVKQVTPSSTNVAAFRLEKQ